jgi:predicted glycosyltransferase/CheY-like chemotaxis protein
MVATEKVLIVEDDSIVQLHLRMIVQELGYAVCGMASTEQEALTSAVETVPDLVLMDIHLSANGDGIEVARKLRVQHDTAVVFLTAYADEETVGRAQAAGALGYLVKPISKPQLRAALSTAFNEQRRRRRAEQGEHALAGSQSGGRDAIIVADDQGMISFINPIAAALVGCKQHQALDRSVLEVLQASGKLQPSPAPRGEAGAKTASCTLADLDLAILDANGRRLEARTETLRDTDGTRRGTIIVFKGDSTRVQPAQPRAMTERRPFGVGTRVAIFSHDTLGLGHLQRSLNISRALTARFPGVSILLLTGSPAVHRYALPQGVDYIKLPAVRKVGSERYQARSLGLSDAGILKLRSNILLRSLQDYDPHVLLVDHAPVGMKGELRPALEWLRDNRPTCIKMLGLRDVLDDPEGVVASWQEHGIYDVLREIYQHILIYGQADVFDPAAAYRFPPEVKSKVVYCNYVVDLEPPAEGVEIARHGSRPLVVVTVGGGDGGEPLIGAYLDMLSSSPAPIGHDTILLTGPFLDQDALARFREQTSGLPVTLLDFVPSTSPYLERADLVICTGGYNTVVQTLRFGKKALLVPRVMHRKEQLIRATRLAELGLVTLLPPGDVTPEHLRACVEAALTDPSQPLVEARAIDRLRFDGAACVAEVCAQLMVSDSVAD